MLFRFFEVSLWRGEKVLPFKFFSVFPRRERFRMQEVTFFFLFYYLFYSTFMCQVLCSGLLGHYSGIVVFDSENTIPWILRHYSILITRTQYSLIRHYSGLLMCYSGIVVFDLENTHKVVTPTSPLLESRKVVFRKVN